MKTMFALIAVLMLFTSGIASADPSWVSRSCFQNEAKDGIVCDFEVTGVDKLGIVVTLTGDLTATYECRPNGRFIFQQSIDLTVVGATGVGYNGVGVVNASANDVRAKPSPSQCLGGEWKRVSLDRTPGGKVLLSAPGLPTIEF